MKKYTFIIEIVIVYTCGASLSFAQNQDMAHILNLVKSGKSAILSAHPLHPRGQFHLSTDEADDIVQMTKLENTISNVENDFQASSLQSCPLPNADERDHPLYSISNDNSSSDILFLEKFPTRKGELIPALPDLGYTDITDNNYSDYIDYVQAQVNANAPLYPNQLSEKIFEDMDENKISFLTRLGVVNTIRNHLILNPIPEVFHKTMERFKDELTFDEKLYLAAQLGKSFGSRYNEARRANQPTKWGDIVDVYELLESVKNQEPGGVCRDIAQAQAQILNELGVKNTYVIAYAVPGDHHASLVTQDPHHKYRLYKISYGSVSIDRPSLEHPSNYGNVGLSFRIYDARGRPVANLPSDFGNILSQATSMDESKRDPFLQDRTQLRQVEVSGLKGVRGRLFSGQTSSGDPIAGISAIRPFSTKDAHVQGSIAGGISQFDIPQKTIPLSGNHLYARLQSALYTPEIKRNGFYIRGESALDLAIAHVITKTPHEKSEEITTGNLSETVGVKGGMKKPGSKTAVEFEAQSEFYPDIAHVQSGRIDLVGLYPNATILRSHIEHQYNRDLAALMEATVALRNVGENYSFRVGLLRPESHQQYSVGIEAPSRNDIPRFFPGSVPRCTATAQGPLCGFDVRLSYETTLESDPQQQLQIEMQKKF